MLSIWQFYSWTFSLENETISIKFTSDCWCIWENFCGIHISSLSVEYTFPSLRKHASFFAPSPSGVSREMPLRPGAEKDGCFRRALHVSSLSTFQFTALISSDLQWLAKLVLVVQLLKSAQNFRPEKKNFVEGEWWTMGGVWPHGYCTCLWMSSSLGSSPGWGHCAVFWDTTLYSLSASLSTQVYKWVLANLNAGDNHVMD